MDLKRTRIIAYLAVLTIAFAAIPPSDPAALAQSAEPQTSGRTLTTTLCVACHTLGRVVSAKRTEEGWRNTIDRHNLPKGQISDDEIETIVGYLAAQFGVGPAGLETQTSPQGEWQFSFQGSAEKLYLPFSTKYECEEARSRGLLSTQEALSEYGDEPGDSPTDKRIIQLQRVLRTTSPCHPVEE